MFFVIRNLRPTLPHELITAPRKVPPPFEVFDLYLCHISSQLFLESSTSGHQSRCFRPDFTATRICFEPIVPSSFTTRAQTSSPVPKSPTAPPSIHSSLWA